MERIGVFVVGVAVVIGLIALFTLPVMWLWNWLMPLIFGLIKLNFWQCFGLMLLSNFLLKSHSYNKSE